VGGYAAYLFGCAVTAVLLTAGAQLSHDLTRAKFRRRLET
jgi:hypothetical protein